MYLYPSYVYLAVLLHSPPLPINVVPTFQQITQEVSVTMCKSASVALTGICTKMLSKASCLIYSTRFSHSDL